MNVLYGHSDQLVHVGKSTTVETCRGMGAATADRTSIASWLEQGGPCRRLDGHARRWALCAERQQGGGVL